MTVTSPLQILLFRHPDDTDLTSYEDAIICAFQGGKEAGGYLASGEDLGIQMEIFSSKPGLQSSTIIDQFCHTLVIVLVDDALLEKGDDDLWDWLADCWNHVNNSDGRHMMLPVVIEERIGALFSKKRPGLEALQYLLTYSLGEREIRPAVLAMRILHECRLLLTSGFPVTSVHSTSCLKLFVSHAKLDGLPLAQALKELIRTLGLQSFYDADDLPPGCNWQRELERAVGSSIIIMLRTEVYDSRPWCQQEVRWADEYATPAVLVDARTGLNFAGNSLPYDRVPSVRIPDGNLMRILFLALREGLRFVHFIRRVEQMRDKNELPSSIELKVFSFPPSMSALLRACQSLNKSKEPKTTPRIILYPDPPLQAGTYEAAQALVAAYAPGALLVTPNTLVTIREEMP